MISTHTLCIWCHVQSLSFDSTRTQNPTHTLHLQLIAMPVRERETHINLWCNCFLHLLLRSCVACTVFSHIFASDVRQACAQQRYRLAFKSQSLRTQTALHNQSGPLRQVLLRDGCSGSVLRTHSWHLQRRCSTLCWSALCAIAHRSHETEVISSDHDRNVKPKFGLVFSDKRSVTNCIGFILSI